MAAAAAVAAGVAALTGCSTTASGTASGGAFYGGPGPLEDVGLSDASAGISEDVLSLGTFYGGPGIIGGGITCRTSAGCLPGQVCCGTLNLTTSCQAGPCPSTAMLGQLQLCGVSAECLTAGDTCAPLAIATSLGVAIMTCNAPSDGGTTDEGGVGEGGSAGGDTGISDAPTGG